MIPQTSTPTRKSEAQQQRTAEESRRDAVTKREKNVPPVVERVVVTKPEDDKYFDVPCTD